jgi:hypothetical protein
VLKLLAIRLSDRPGDVLEVRTTNAQRQPIKRIKFSNAGKTYCIEASTDPKNKICWIGEIAYDGKSKAVVGSWGGYNRTRLHMFWQETCYTAIPNFIKD